MILDRVRYMAITGSVDGFVDEISLTKYSQCPNQTSPTSPITDNDRIFRIEIGICRSIPDVLDMLVGLGGFCLRLFEFIDVCSINPPLQSLEISKS
jgi:hypothetical protein